MHFTKIKLNTQEIKNKQIKNKQIKNKQELQS